MRLDYYKLNFRNTINLLTSACIRNIRFALHFMLNVDSSKQRKIKLKR